ncbi:hypothetical protein EfmAA610_12030 [Enterococcus faecium]|nr:hypothetical protein EfmAA610_12030 [Enterococcus faecium]
MVWKQRNAKNLDKIEEGTEAWVKVVDRFYKPFEKELTNAEEKIEKIQIKDEVHLIIQNH